jgi:hypothetical protein
MGFDECWLSRIDLDFLAQAADLVIDTTIEYLRGAATRQIKQLITAQHHLRVVQKGTEQQKLGGAERYATPSRQSAHAVASGIQRSKHRAAR